MELLQWEENNNFKSLGLKSELLISRINPQDFPSESSIRNYVEENSEFLELIDDNGDVYLEPKYHNIPYRYLGNYNGIFQIGDRYYKVVDRGMVSSRSEDLDLLLAIHNLRDVNDNNKINISYEVLDQEVETRCLGCYSCPPDVERSTNRNNRIKIEVGLGLTTDILPGTGLYQRWTMLVSARPYHRILGIWYWAQRTITYDFKLSMDFYEWVEGNPQKTGWDRIKHQFSGSYYGWDVERKIEVLDGTSIDNYHITSVKMSGYDILGDTPDVSPAELACHTEVF